MKKILGLDLGTNSIGWALIEQDFEHKAGQILGMGSRIIPMGQDKIGDFEKGNTKSQTAERTGFRGIRRLRERHLLRRERLHRVLNILDFLPAHYAQHIDFQHRLGQFIEDAEPKLAYYNKEFIFKKSYDEMLHDFRLNQPELINCKNRNGQDVKIPYDWTIYYLRKKALTEKLEKAELAWLILNFNQKRGYYQLRGEEEDEPSNKLVEFHSLKIIDVLPDDKPNNKGELWYSLHLENGWIYRRSSKSDLSSWKDKTRDFIVTSDIDENGTVKTDKEGVEKRSFRAPSDDDWTLLKKKSENEINLSQNTVGTYIYNNLLQKPNQKIRGKLVRTIERKYYKDELKQILEKQIQLQPELFSPDSYSDCIRELYRNNEAHQLKLSKQDFIHLIVEDILFYQRPLKSKKSSIGNCTLESRKFQIKDEDGNLEYKIEFLKGIPKSNPIYQEFRIWQWLYNLKFYRKEDEVDVTSELIKQVEGIENLFEFLMSQKEVDHKSILKHLLAPLKLKSKALSSEIAKYRWNFVYDINSDESKKYPCNETRHEIRQRLSKVENVPENFLNTEIEYALWHLIYSVTDKIEYDKALKSFSKKHHLDENTFLEHFTKFKPFESEYGTYSEKAIKKLLPLMRIGKYWDWNAIDNNTKQRIDRIITGEYDKEIKERVREKAINLTGETHFQGLQLWLAQYIVYDRHSEAALAGKWKSCKDLENYLQDFKQHSLRNPIVEQVVTETLRVVKDIWSKFGNGTENYFDEIHIELGRDMKNTKEQRKRISSKISDNENTNLRIKALISELKADSDIQNVRPFSPSQQEALKIYEEYALSSDEKYNQQTQTFEHDPVSDEIIKISKTAQPNKSDLHRYKLWLEQRYRSPYTGAMIPLTRLFTEDYQIEHIIPQSRYFDDSLSNKVICEAAVNQLKDKQLGMEFIKNHHGEMVPIGLGKIIKILNEDDYTDFVKQHYSKNQNKRDKLLLEEIPEKMIERQLNDTRYISKFISNLLSNLVRENKNDEGINSKNILPGNGTITSKLKNEWGLNDVWNALILPRFQRMNTLMNSSDFTSLNTNGKLIPTVPLDLSKGFQKKRIDHRHHAMDALVIACTTRGHINYLNNQNAHKPNSNEKEGFRYDLKYTLCFKTKPDQNGNYKWQFKKPWENFTTDTKAEIEKTVVSFKQNLRIINKTTNRYESYKDEKGNIRTDKDGRPKKGLTSQIKGDSWAIRKPMHKDTISGLVDLPNIKVPKGKILTATRKAIDSAFTAKTIESITDTSIQKILSNYLIFKNNDSQLAFSPEGLEELNQNLAPFNGGKPHKPIKKVRIFEVGSKFPLGQTGNKTSKYVEAAKGTNLFFAIYQDENGKRNYETVALNIVIERQKQGLSSVPETNERGHHLLFTLSPNDLVYVRNEVESISTFELKNITKEEANKIYKMVSSSGTQCYFIRHDISTSIVNKTEFSALNKMEKSIEGTMIKETCIKLDIDRIGNVGLASQGAPPYDQNNHVVHESQVPYIVSKKIVLDTSPDASEQDEFMYSSGLTPEQRFSHFLALISRFYTFDKPNWSTKKIILDS